MRADATGRAGGDAPGPAGVLGDLVPDPTVFADRYWGREPLLTRAHDLTGLAHKLLDLAGVDALLSERGLRTPFVRLTRDGVVVQPGRYTSGGGAGASIADQVSDTAITQLLLDGATVVLQGLHRTWGPIADFVAALSMELSAPVQANAYLTPPDSRGFDAHYDVHDVFVVQLSGRKHWRVHPVVHTDPLADQPWTDHRAAVVELSGHPPSLEVELEPGDVLYLPRGTVHAAVTRDALSAHLTLGIHPVTPHAVAVVALELAKAAPGMRTSFPMGAPLDGPAANATIASALAQLSATIAALTPEDIAAALADQLLPQTRPAPLGPVAQAQASGTLQACTRLRRRAGLQSHLAMAPDMVTVRLFSGRHTFPPAELAAIRVVLAGAIFVAGQLPELTGEASLALARRLLGLGVVVPA